MLKRNRRNSQLPLETLSDLKSHIRRLRECKADEGTANPASLPDPKASKACSDPSHPTVRQAD